MNYYDNPYPNNPNFWQGETGKPYDSEAGSKMSDVRENSKKKETLYQGKAGNTPVIPLPNPGEGGPVYNGGAQNTPVIPLPNPGGGGPVYDGETENTPIIPLPNPGEGGPVYPGPIITVPVRPVIPCFFCNTSGNGEMRFLNTAIDYGSFVIAISNKTVVEGLEYAEVSEYGTVASGYQTVTVSGANGYIYISKQVRVMAGSKMTVAIVNVAGGLDFTVINDVVCSTPYNGACIRACNLSYNAGSLDFYLGRQLLIFANVSFMEVTNYRKILTGTYVFHISNEAQALTATEIQTRNNSQYTIYCFNWSKAKDAIRTLVIEDKK